MLNVYFNPYPGISADYESGKACLFSTANTYRKLSNDIKLLANNPEGNDSIKFFSLAEDKQGFPYTPSSLLRHYSGRDHAIVKWFLRMFDKGKRLNNDDLSICEDWVLRDIEVAAPILEYASRQDGMAVTISDDHDWKSDFFLFIDQPDQLPNINGQDALGPLKEWIEKWFQRNLSFQSLLEQSFNIIFCPGASNTCFPSRYEEKGVLTALNRAQDLGYEIDGDLIKNFKTKHGNIKELRSFGDGVRLFFTLKEGQVVLGGFYRKSAAIKQNKAGEYAAGRLKDNDYL